MQSLAMRLIQDEPNEARKVVAEAKLGTARELHEVTYSDAATATAVLSAAIDTRGKRWMMRQIPLDIYYSQFSIV